MTRYHIIIENESGLIVGQFDVSQQSRRDDIVNNLPSDLSVKTERQVPEQANLGNSTEKMSENIVEWDDRLFTL